MSLPIGHSTNFDTLMRAVMQGDVALLECRDSRTGKIVAAICVMSRRGDGETDMMPIARMHDVDDLNALEPPDPKGGFKPAVRWEPDES